MRGGCRGQGAAAKRARDRSPRERRSAAATAALRSAALLRGGVPAARVWRMLGEESGAPPELVALADDLARGESIPAALAAQQGEEWRVLAVAWRLAEQSGAPLSAVLERLAAALAALERLGERRSVLLAGPRATIRLVAVLPFVALLLGAALGFDPLEALVTPAGSCAVIVGGALLGAGVQWARLLADRLASAEWVSGLECELCWITLSGGAAPRDALRRLADGIDCFELEWVRLAELRRRGTVRAVLARAASLGAPVGPMLLAEAEAARARSLAALEREAERLAVRVLLPIGLCVLPAFILLGVLPVLLAVLGSLDPLG